MKHCCLILMMICSLQGQAGKITSAYKALSVFDYFKARQLFYASLSRDADKAAYGLATIYARNDNPFTNIDSAARYIALSAKTFRDTITLSGYHLSRGTIGALSDSIALKGFRIYSSGKQVASLNHFLEYFYFGKDTLLQRALDMRDKLYIDRYNSLASSDSMMAFLLAHPETVFYPAARKSYYGFQYAEQTRKGSEEELKRFLLRYPDNPNATEAENRLFQLMAQKHSPDSLYSFIRSYSRNNRDEAWKMLYGLSVKKASRQELSDFLGSYPDYPYRSEVEREMEWAQQDLYPLRDAHEKYGYIDSSGSWQILPVFDDANAFHEGFAGVCRNDSCYFINKSGERLPGPGFEETDDYHNGIAIVKKQNRYYLINRAGQLVSKGFEDISPASDNLFVARQNGLYGAIGYKAETVIPFSYKKLGSFRNGYAYYAAEKYGLVSKENKVLQAQWEWVSDIDTNSLVIVKQDGRFGLMDLGERLLLGTHYDYISHCVNDIYLLVKNDLYGFYSSSGRCFIADVAFSYNKAYENSYYTNGRQFKLIRSEEVALMDANGRISIPFGTYTDVFFAKDEVIRVLKGKRYGYMDRKLKAITAAEFDKASDFSNGVAIVSKAGSVQLIHKSGKVLFALRDGSIERTADQLYKTGLGGLNGLISANGEVLLPNEFSSLEPLRGSWWTGLKNGQLYLYKADQKKLIQVK